MTIEVKKVSKKFGDTIIINDANLIFKEGNIYGLIGVNGSGKTVLLKMLCAFYEPTNGEILYDSENIIKEQKYPPETRALIEKPNFLPDISGEDNLKLLAQIQSKIGEKEIEIALEQVGLLNDKDKIYHKYSLGMKQKLGIAQVIMENPKVMIFDEPFNGLDTESAKKIRKILLEEKKKGKIIIIATHILEDIKELCNEVYRIENGTITKTEVKEVD